MSEWTFANEIKLVPINLARAALYFAQAIAYPQLDVPHYLGRLEALAAEAGAALPADASLPGRRAVLLAEYLFDTAAFRGNSEAYDDPRNSYLNEVLERRLGIPISLSVLYLDVARRLGIAAHGISLPGHFIVGVVHEGETWYLDPFHGGGRLSHNDCARLVQQTTGHDGPFQMAWLRPAAASDILIRMLYNLRVVYVQRKAWGRAAAVIDQLRLIQPGSAEHLRDLGLVHYRMRSWRLAARYLEQYVQQRPHAPDAEMIRQGMSEALHAWGRLN